MSVALSTAQALTLWHDVALAMVRDDEPDLSVRQVCILLTIYLEAPPHTVRDLAKFEMPKKVVLIERDFTIESGELTPSMKVKRNVVEGNNKERIDAFYS